MKAPDTAQPEEEVKAAIDDIPPTVEATVEPVSLQQQLHAIDAQIQEYEDELALHQERSREILPELERLKKSVVEAEQTEFRDAVAEQLKKYHDESVKKQLDRIYQTKVKDPKIDYTRANISKLDAALWYSNSQAVKLKGKIDSLKKQRNNLLAGNYVEKIRRYVKDFGSKYIELKEVYQETVEAIGQYRAIESDLPARLRAMGIVDPFMTELWGLLGSRDLEGKMLDVINNMAGRWSISDNPFSVGQQKITGRPDEHHFGLERPFGHASVQR